MSKNAICNDTATGPGSMVHGPAVLAYTFTAVQLMRNPFALVEILD